jgi:vacuolar-type H+-ATPase subunit F/Vma7
MKIKVIGDEFTCLGFALSGVSTTIVKGEDSVLQEFEKALGDNEVVIILVT